VDRRRPCLRSRIFLWHRHSCLCSFTVNITGRVAYAFGILILISRQDGSRSAGKGIRKKRTSAVGAAQKFFCIAGKNKWRTRRSLNKPAGGIIEPSSAPRFQSSRQSACPTLGAQSKKGGHVRPCSVSGGGLPGRLASNAFHQASSCT